MVPVVEELYQRYYVEDATPDWQVSSHWREQHSRTFVIGERGEYQTHGEGFGDVTDLSFASRSASFLTIKSYLQRLGDAAQIRDMIPMIRSVAHQMGLDYSYDVFRQGCAYTLIEQYLPTCGRALRCVEIGGGYGLLSGIVKRRNPSARMVMIDLGKTLFFQARHLAMAFPDAKMGLVTDGLDCADVDFLFCPAEHASELEGPFDLFVNIASMQEMSPEVIGHYFRFIRLTASVDNLFYCCNRVHKTLSGGRRTTCSATFGTKMTDTWWTKAVHGTCTSSHHILCPTDPSFSESVCPLSTTSAVRYGIA